MRERPGLGYTNAPSNPTATSKEMRRIEKGVETGKQASLATDFSKQTSPLSASQIDSLKNLLI